MKRDVSCLFENLPECLSDPPKKYFFGTAGYRDIASDLNSCISRASLLAYIRSATFCGKTIGIMITASHNPKSDNGIKIIDHNGEYIDRNLELYCDEIVNCPSKELLRTLSKIHRKLGNMRDFGDGALGSVAIGRDTRESGEQFEKEITSVLSKLPCNIINYGIVSTPQLHFLVRNSNKEGKIKKKEEYIDHLAFNYEKLVYSRRKEELPCLIDCAHGVGGLVINELKKKLKNKEMRIINDFDSKEPNKNGEFIPDSNLLNLRCGSDFIVSQKRAPENLSTGTDKIKRCVSFDGDADRIVYFSTDPVFSFLDGDRIAIFLVKYIYNKVMRLKVFFQSHVLENIKIGVVLSHYSNSAAMGAINDKIAVILSKTGVKNFITMSRKFDIGVFFEPNGHGSVTFSLNFTNELKRIIQTPNIDPEAFRIASILSSMTYLFDQNVGDAVANFLVLETLFERETYKQIMNMYENLPTRALTVKVIDKSIIKIENEIELLEPKQLQIKIAELCKRYKGRAFVRPSGTEDIVRVFAESSNVDECDALCVNVAQAVYDICQGVGFHPEIKY